MRCLRAYTPTPSKRDPPPVEIRGRPALSDIGGYIEMLTGLMAPGNATSVEALLGPINGSSEYGIRTMIGLSLTINGGSHVS